MQFMVTPSYAAYMQWSERKFGHVQGKAGRLNHVFSLFLTMASFLARLSGAKASDYTTSGLAFRKVGHV
jgi:hypothetical protein